MCRTSNVLSHSHVRGWEIESTVVITQSPGMLPFTCAAISILNGHGATTSESVCFLV